MNGEPSFKHRTEVADLSQGGSFFNAICRVFLWCYGFYPAFNAVAFMAAAGGAEMRVSSYIGDAVSYVTIAILYVE
ncbi:hypothetical protein [Erwinia sp. HR93]|uniref:hypothetical protein n=1 Tax=Erwinia sp. HR93 TaxID=3094840 RepID=UPI002ADEC1F0|nr:hypothetical protein [Erwinia sp. HR93]MEA1065204.1 hypothetical protein [Erwinia sp. HR93]